MAVRVDEGVADRVVEDRGGYLQAQVRSGFEVARLALERAAEEIASLDAGWESAIGLGPGHANTPNYVSQVSDSPIGPYVYIDAKHMPDEFLRRYPQVVADHLTRAGVADALVTSPLVGGPLDDLLTLPRALTLHARTSNRGSLPGGWLADAVAWVRDRSDASALMAGAGPVQLSTTPDQAAELLDTCNRSGSAWLLASGDLQRRALAAHGEYQLGPELVVAAGGPGVGDRELAGLAEELRALARRLAPDIAHGFIAMEPGFGDLLAGPHQLDADQADQDPVATARLADVLVPDAFWYQVLSPGHLRRLGAAPAGARPLPGGRAELTLGDPVAWIAGRGDAGLRAVGRQRLGRLLATRVDARRMWEERRRADLRRRAGGGATP
jgi:hypothetical protein